ncbi:hypothetical protein A2U01_0116376, partial [Trifolium medium]|nr:hypothetical protein [Trifolium medium]
SPTHNRNTGGVGGFEVEPDAAAGVEEVEVVLLMLPVLLPVLPLNLSMPSKRMLVQEALLGF